MGASPALMRRLRFSVASLKGMCVSVISTFVISLMCSKSRQESSTGTSGQSVHSMLTWIGSVALNWVSAA